MTPLNTKQATARRAGMAERAAALKALHFPNFPDAWLWERTKTKGFATVPRTLPIVMEAIDHQSSGQPAGHTLFCLWARAPDGPLVVIESPATFASEAGFTGKRAVDTWRRRMKWLRDHHFIGTSPGASGDFHHVLLFNPNVAVELMRHRNQIQTELYGRFWDRLTVVGGIGEIVAIREHWKAEEAAKAAQAAAAASVPPAPKATKKSAKKSAAKPASKK